MLYDPWIRVLLLGGIWLLLAALLAWALTGWWRHQARMDQLDQEARARERAVMDLLEGKGPQN